MNNAFEAGPFYCIERSKRKVEGAWQIITAGAGETKMVLNSVGVHLSHLGTRKSG